MQFPLLRAIGEKEVPRSQISGRLKYIRFGALGEVFGQFVRVAAEALEACAALASLAQLVL